MRKLFLSLAAAGGLLFTAPAQAQTATACSSAGAYTASQVFANGACFDVGDKRFSSFNGNLDLGVIADWTFVFNVDQFDIYSNDANVIPPATFPGDALDNPTAYYGYILEILDPTKEFASVTVDTTGARVPEAGSNYGAAKLVSNTPFVSPDFIASIAQSVAAIQSIDGDQGEAAAVDVDKLAQTIYVRDFLQTEGRASLQGVTNSYTQRTRSQVPGPLGVAGVFGAFAWSRQLRRRIRNAAA